MIYPINITRQATVNELEKHLIDPSDAYHYEQAVGLINRRGPQTLNGRIYSLDLGVMEPGNHRTWRIVVSSPTESV